MEYINAMHSNFMSEKMKIKKLIKKLLKERDEKLATIREANLKGEDLETAHE